MSSYDNSGARECAPVSRPASNVVLALVAVALVGAAGVALLPFEDVPAEHHQLPAGLPLTVTTTGSPPTNVVVSTNYPVEVGAGSLAQVGGKLLEVRADGIGPGGSVSIQAFPPGQPAAGKTITIPGGVLLVSGDPAEELTLTVSTPTGVPLQPAQQVALIRINAPQSRIDVLADVNERNFLHLSFSKFWSVEYDHEGDAVDVAMVNPMSTVAGKLLGKNVAAPDLGPTWLHARWQAGTFSLDLLRTGTGIVDRNVPAHMEFATDQVQGDPLGSGMVVRADGQQQLTINLAATQPDLVQATIGGGMMEQALGGPLVLGLHHYGLLPWDSVLEMYYGNEVDDNLQAAILQPATLRPLFEASAHPDSASVTLPTLAKRIVFPGGSAGISADSSSGALDVTDGAARLLGVEIKPTGGPATAPTIVLSGRTLTEHGLEDPTIITVDYLAGLVTTASGAGPALVLATMGDLAGNTILSAENSEGGVHVQAGASKLAVAGGSIRLGDDPALPQSLSIRVLDGNGATAMEAEAQHLSPLASEGYPVVTASAGGQTTVLAAPLQLDGAPGAWTGFRVWNPANSSQTLVAYDASGLEVLGQHVDHPQLPEAPQTPEIPEAPEFPETPNPPDPAIVPDGDPLGDAVTTFQIGPATVTIDRTTTPPTIIVDGVDVPALPGPEDAPEAPDAPQAPGANDLPDGDIDHQPAEPQKPTLIQPPLVITGPPEAPTSVDVLDPDTMEAPPVVSYHRNADGTTTVFLPDGSEHTLPSASVTSQGLPLSSPQWTLIVSMPGSAPQRITVDRAQVQSQLYGNNVDIEPFVSVLAGASPSLQFYKVASDGARSLDPGNLTGSRWLNGHGDISVRVDVPKGQDTYAPILLWASGSLPQRGTSPSLSMADAGRTGDFHSYRAAIPAAWLAGADPAKPVVFALGFDVGTGTPVRQSFLDDNEGAGYRFKSDRDAPSAANVQLSPSPANPTILRVSWSASDGGSSVKSYDIQTKDGTGAWEDWVQRGSMTSADFTGLAGSAYKFRARASDTVDNLGLFGPEATHDIPGIPGGGAGDGDGGSGEGNVGGDGDGGQSGLVNHAPTVRLLAPIGGETFTAQPTVNIRWEAADIDGTTPVVTLSVSGDGGTNWEVLATPEGTAYAWDIARLVGDQWRVKASVSDGSLQDADTSARFAIDNSALGTADTIGGADNALPLSEPGQGNDQGQQGGSGLPPAAAAGDLLPTLAFAALLIAGAAGVAAWKLGWIGGRKP
jgi:hypothetical protein